MLKLKHFMIPAVLFLLSGLVIPALATTVRDDFDSDNGFTPVIIGDPNKEHWQVVNGVLMFSLDPSDFYTSGAVKKEYDCDLTRDFSFEFRLRMTSCLLGLDSYTTLTFTTLNTTTNRVDTLGFLTVGINSEQHWKRIWFELGPKYPCTAKDNDDEFFISTNLFNAPDTRLRYPKLPMNPSVVYKNPYTEWTTFKILYKPPVWPWLKGKFTFFVGGYKLDDLTILDDPTHQVIPQTNKLKGRGVNKAKVEISLWVFNDGFEDGHPGNKYGRRGYGCYAKATPAVPSAVVYPPKFEGNDGSGLKAPWMNKFDEVADELIGCMLDFQLNDGTKPCATLLQPYVSTSGVPRGALSAVDNMHAVESTNPLGLFGLYARYYAYLTPGKELREEISDAFRQYVRERILQRIQANTLDFETCVLMGAIELPSQSDQIWTSYPTDTYSKLKIKLDRYKTYYPKTMAQPEMFVWDTLYNSAEDPNNPPVLGGWADAIHLGYLEPGAVRASPAWRHVPTGDTVYIISPSQPMTGTVEWDYFQITN